MPDPSDSNATPEPTGADSATTGTTTTTTEGSSPRGRDETGRDETPPDEMGPGETPPDETGRDWTPRALAGIYLRGLCMGAADAVPGVSGGTIALITGIYERLITALTAVSPRRIARVLGAVLTPHRSRARQRARQALIEVDALFLSILGAGVFSAVLIVASAVEIAVDQYPVPTFGFFLGLIGASAIVLAMDVALETPGDILAGAAGFLVAFFVSGFAADSLGHPLPVVFFAGAIAVSAMILPGISGSLLLLLLGQYDFILGETLPAVRDGLFALATGGDTAGLAQPATVAAVFATGMLVGLFTVAHAVRFALDRRRQATLAFLLMLVVGALRAPLLQISSALSAAGRSWDTAAITAVAVTALLGVLVVLLIERAAGGIQLETY